jgi:hypothetical protein
MNAAHPVSKFFREVVRPPAVERLNESRFRLRFFAIKRVLLEFATIGSIGMLFTLYLKRYAGYWAFAPFAVLPFGYLVIASQMKRTEATARVEVDGDQLFLGRPELARVGAVREILHVSLSGHEDSECTESGSSRLYVAIESDIGFTYLPLLIGSCDLRPVSESIAATIKCPYRQGKGLGAIPASVRPLPW